MESFVFASSTPRSPEPTEMVRTAATAPRCAFCYLDLRKQPSVEPLDRLLLVLSPPFRVRLQQQLEIVRRRREIFGALLENVVVGLRIGGTIGQERGELGLPLRIGAEFDEPLSEVHFGIALGDHP